MELLKGTAAKTRFSTEVSGGENSTTTQIAILEIDKKPTEIKLHESILIEDGDKVAVAGKSKRGLFKAVAYNNLTKGVSGKGPALLILLLGIPFCVIGIPGIIAFFAILIMEGLKDSLWVCLMLSVFGAVGIYTATYSRYLSKAYKMVMGCQ